MAIVKAEGLNRPALPLGDSDTIRVGEAVIAIGTALGEFRHTVTTGVISGLGRGIVAGDGFSSAEELENVIQTDAAINPGNSGGPLINALGKVIGVNVAVSQSAQNIGFAIPINVIKASLDNFNQTGQFSRPYLGVSYQMITERAALANEVPQGAYIAEVAPNSPAERIGLQPGDILVAIDDQKLKDIELMAVLNSMRVGQTVRLEVWRAGETLTLTVPLESNE
jgi:S1-C subfamily serine protease